MIILFPNRTCDVALRTPSIREFPNTMLDQLIETCIDILEFAATVNLFKSARLFVIIDQRFR